MGYGFHAPMEVNGRIEYVEDPLNTVSYRAVTKTEHKRQSIKFIDKISNCQRII